MKKGWKIFWIVLLILFVLVAAFVGLTIYQAMKLVKLTQDTNLQNSFQALANGDCSNLPELETKLPQIKKDLQSACANPVLKAIVQQKAPAGVDICAEANKPDSQIEAGLAQIRSSCANKTG